MSRTYSSTELARACVKKGWQLDRQKGFHIAFVKQGAPRPIIIPQGRRDVARFIVSTICDQLGIEVEDLPDLV